MIRLSVVGLLLIYFSFLSCSGRNKTLFKKISPSHSGIKFNNAIIENDSINVLDLYNVYNGGGVGLGDFNNDGLMDIYFTGNLVSNKLYLNKGNFRFEDITNEAKVGGDGKWCRGVSVVDINSDGLMDIYVCGSMSPDSVKRENLLYINKGMDKNGIPHFAESAREYGLNDNSNSTQAVFFDYDNDGDLDVFICVNSVWYGSFPNKFGPVIRDGSSSNTDRLYRNDGNDSLGHPFFINVSKQAGILIGGYSHAVTITDFNNDGWKDIYVTNDYVSNNILYVNNRDGTFTDHLFGYLKHSSANAMGNDINDINNDGLLDIIELDMDPEDNLRKKMMMNSMNYQTYINSDYFGYHYQYVRNTLQVNQGPRMNQNDSIGDPIFSEVGFYSGIAETDWSWAPLVSDFDNDGYKDIIITNGFPKDVTDHDFGAFRNQSLLIATKTQLLEQIPEVKLHNYAFHNNGNLTFSDVSKEWGLSDVSFSNGAVYADFDNDGDLDMVLNNINDPAFLYENTLNLNKETPHNYLQVQLKGNAPNTDGYGAWVKIFYGGQQQVYEFYTVRGYLSSVSSAAHFGFKEKTLIDSLIVIWPDNKKQTLRSIKTNQVVTLKQTEATEKYEWAQPLINHNNLFKEVTNSLGIDYHHNETDYIDFNRQRLLPHKFSQYSPGIAVGDFNGDGFDDFITGGSPGYSAMKFIQKVDGTFSTVPLLKTQKVSSKKSDDRGLLLFDADGDGDLDLYISAGGYAYKPGDKEYSDFFYINDGKGNFTGDTMALPFNTTSKFCVRACDYDQDGDLDLFIAGRVDPWNYPKAVSSFIYRNDSKNEKIKFTDATAVVAPSLINMGLACDGVWTDFDNDGWQDLIVAGEWMPIKFFRNDHGYFKDVTPAKGISTQLGWWNSIISGDFDNDGDIDYVVGNLGENSYYKASDRYPVSVYAKDFDGNGVMECIPTKYIIDKVEGSLKEFTTHTRDDVVDQMPFVKKRFLTYKSFATETFDQLFTPDQIKGAIKYSANYFESAFIRNNGNGTFTLEPLPDVAQYSVINGMVVDDFDGDGNLDICMSTNDYGTEPGNGRYDALNGLILKGNGKGVFTPLSILQSGIFIPGNGKALVKLRNKNGKYLIAAGQNRGPLKVFELKKNITAVPLQANDVSAQLKYKNGLSQKQEFYYGSSFLSQSARFLNIGDNIESVTIYDSRGGTRRIHF